MKRICFFIIVSITLLNSCQSVTTSTRTKFSQKTNQIFKDNAYQTGFSLTPLDPKTVKQRGGHEKAYIDTLDFRKGGSNPLWRLSQWYSKYNLANSKPLDGPDGSIYYVNEGNSRKIALYPDNSLLLEVNASKEYDRARINGQNWPHLLIEQNFNEDSPNIGKVKQLLFSMELKLEKEENKMPVESFDESLHTAQSPFFFILKNDNKNSSDFGQKIWFGIPSYDYRYSKMNNKEKVMWDIGTSTYIYNVPQRTIWGDISFQDKKWHKGKADIKPLITRALVAMREKGVFNNTSLDDLVIIGMNFGWEVPGTFDVAIRVKNISLISIE